MSFPGGRVPGRTDNYASVFSMFVGMCFGGDNEQASFVVLTDHR